VRASHPLARPGPDLGRRGFRCTTAPATPRLCSFKRDHYEVNSGRHSLASRKGREFFHFMVGLLLLLIINLTPSSALGKIVRFTDSRGVIHISSAGQELSFLSRIDRWSGGLSDIADLGNFLEAATGFEPVNNGFAVLKKRVSKRKQEKVTFNSFKQIGLMLSCMKKPKSAGKTG